jgi:hypothetical protein
MVKPNKRDLNMNPLERIHRLWPELAERTPFEQAQILLPYLTEAERKALIKAEEKRKRREKKMTQLPCSDCGADTTPVTRHGCEYYMVTADVWESAKIEMQGILCIGCLENRLGRRLQPCDFSTAPVNDPDPIWDTPRLRDRKGQ